MILERICELIVAAVLVVYAVAVGVGLTWELWQCIKNQKETGDLSGSK